MSSPSQQRRHHPHPVAVVAVVRVVVTVPHAAAWRVAVEDAVRVVLRVAETVHLV